MEQEINAGHYFEIMDRSHVIIDNIDAQILNHPAMDEENKAKIESAMTIIFDVYQWAGKKHLDMTEGE
jgi:hypothetical protein